jgi:mRNA interferase MazF
MNISQKEIVLLNFPFSDLKGSKIRPALVVSNNSLNERSDDFIAVPFTSVLKDEPYSVLISQKDLVSGKLIVESRIRVDKIFAVDKNLIRMKIGIINDNIFEKVLKEINNLF